MKIFDTTRTDTLIARRDPRVRVCTAALFGVTMCIVQTLPAVLTGIALGVCAVATGRLRLNQLGRRLAELNVFMVLLVVFLPLTAAGTPLFRFGPLSWSQDGLYRAIFIALRANGIMMMTAVLIGAMEPAHLGFALHRLGLPDKLSHLLLFMVRYIEVIHVEYHRLAHAMALRGFRKGFNRHTFRSLGYLTGMLLVRSLDRGQRIMEAMKCRGFQGRFYVLDPFVMQAGDWAFLGVAVCATAGLLVLGLV